jgi:hypothetical protein
MKFSAIGADGQLIEHKQRPVAKLASIQYRCFNKT